MTKTLAALAALLVLACATPQPAGVTPEAAPAPIAPATRVPDAAARFDRLAEEYFEELLLLEPFLASSIGDDRYNDRYSISFSKEHRERSRALYTRYLEALNAIELSVLEGQQAVSADILRRDLQRSLRGLDFPSHLQPLNQFYNFATSFAQMGSGTSIHPFRTTKDYDDFLSRAEGFVEAVDIAIMQMREGIAIGVVQPRVLMEKALPQIEAHVVNKPAESIFQGPIRNMPASIGAEDRARLTASYEVMIGENLIPAYARLRDFVRDEYLPKTRPSVGMLALPDGRRWYEHLVASSTTTSMSPQEIHELGLSEVKRIHGEIEKVMKSVGFEGDLGDFFAFVSSDPQFKYTSREQMLAEYRAAKERIDSRTDLIFDVKPKADYEIRPVEPFREQSAAGGSYQAASADGSRPGVFYLNTYNAPNRSRNGMEALLLHEGSPGHHFQISIQRELEDLPRFRRFGRAIAYSEGWGLYAESLGPELGLYTDPYQRYGSLAAELWRAIRLVLDTGIHALGWTREEALDYGRRNSAQSSAGPVSEVERFIAIPSQALAYKIGQLKITELRRRAEKELGPKFDIKAFHRAVLEDGAVPLDVLEQKIDRWIAGSR
jgi:uncharacterized protein (DUF885 family)